jgi:ribosome-associated protein
MTDKEILHVAATALDSKNARNIKIIKIEKVSSIANYFLLATGTSSTQVKALADETEYKLEQSGLRPTRTEGYQGANWIVLDYADVIIHIFHEETRNFYDLERLWQDGVSVDANEYIDVKE